MIRTLLFLGIVCAAEPQPVLARDNAMPIEAVQMLLSDDVARRSQGNKRIIEERAKLITQLTGLISDPYNHVQRRASVEKAMRILARLRAPEGVNVLVTYIGFPLVHHPQAGEYPAEVVSTAALAQTIDQLLPAIGALIHIGEPCVEQVVNKLATADSVLEIKACQEVLKELSCHRSVRARLEKAIESADPRKRAQLEKALKMLGEEAVSAEK